MRRWLQSSRRSGQDRGRLTEGNPLLYAAQYGLLLWLRADMGITLGGTLRATGTAPPAWTISGTATRQVGLHFEIDSVAGGTGLGQATYKWSEDNGATYVATGVVTAAGPTALGTTGLSVSQAAGPYNIDNKWDATVSAWADQSGKANHATQATASRQPKFSLAGFGGYSALDYGTGTTFGFETPSITMGTHTIMGAVRGDAAGGYLATHVTDSADGGYVYSRNGNATRVIRAAGTSAWNVTATANWVADGVRRTYAQTMGGTHATHVLYRNGAVEPLTDVTAGNPGAATVAGAIYVGNNQAYGTSMRGLYRELLVFSSALPASAVLALHLGMAARSAGAI